MKIIPAIDLIDGQVVRLVKGNPNEKTVYSNNPSEIAKNWQNAGADMLHIVDLDATLGRGSNLSTIKKIANEVQIPVQIAGGLREISLVKEVANIATRIVLGTLAFQNKEALQELLDSLGPKKIVISADHIDGKIVVKGWQERTEKNLIDAVKEFLSMGFTEFLVTNVSRDGMMQGPDLENLSDACSLENANVIASGGITNVNDVKLVKEKNAYGVILGKALYENKITIEEAKKV